MPIERREGAKGVRWRVRVRREGWPEAAKTFDTQAEAKDWERETQLAMSRGTYNAVDPKITCGRVLTWYLDGPVDGVGGKIHARKMRDYAVWWRERIGELYVVALTAPLIREYLDALEVGPATRNKYLKGLRKPFALALREGMVATNPAQAVALLREPSGRTRYLAVDEIQRLYEACAESHDERLELLVRLAIGTGGRQNELLGLKVQDVDLQRGMIRLHKRGRAKTKTRERSVPIPDKALPLMRDRVTDRRSDAFVFDRVGRYRNTASHEFPRKEWLRALERAGIADFTFHDCRHTAASYLAMSGATALEMMEVFGWTSPDMVQRYAHLMQSHVSAVAKRGQALTG